MLGQAATILPAGGAGQSKTCTARGMNILASIPACRQECRQGPGAWQGWGPAASAPLVLLGTSVSRHPHGGH